MGNLMDLNDRLFRELDRLESAEGDELAEEIERAKTISQMAGRVIDNASMVIRAAEMQAVTMDDVATRVAVPRMLIGEATVSARVESDGE